MKNCPKCRVETRSDAVWCWHCGYSFEEADACMHPRPADDDDGVSDPATDEESSH